MEYRVAVVIQPKNSTDLAGTIIYGEHIKDLGYVLSMVTPEHDIIPFADNDQPEIDRRIKNIITEGDLTKEENEYIHNTPELPKFDNSGDASIMIVKKGGESFVHNDIEKYVETLNNIGNDLEPYIMHTKYKGVDRIQMPYLTDELVFWRYKSNANGETKYHSLEEQIRHLLDIVAKEYAMDTDRYLNIINTFYACGCDPKVQSWHKSNLDQINRDDKLLRLFGELSSRRHKIENIEDILNGIKDDITDGCYVQSLNIDRGADRFVNIKIYSNFKFPRVRGIILGYDGKNICAGRFDCISSSGIPLYVAVDTWIGDKANPPILIAPADSSYTITVDTRAKLYLITDIPECVYEVLDDRRISLEEAMRFPLSTQFNGDFIKNTKSHMLYNIGTDSVVAQEISIVGELEENLLEPYLKAYRVFHRLPQPIDEIDDEMMYIICDVGNIAGTQLMHIVIKDNYNNENIILDKTITYNEYKAMAGGYPFRYPTVYPNGIDYTVEVSFVKRDGNMIDNTRLYSIRTDIYRSDSAKIVTEDLGFTRSEIHVKKSNGDAYTAGTIVKATVNNGNGATIYNRSIVVSNTDEVNGYTNLELLVELSGEMDINIEVKEPNKFQSIKQNMHIDMNNILPNNHYNISSIKTDFANIYLNRIILHKILNQDKAYYNASWYDKLNKLYSEYPNDITLMCNSGAPKLEIITRIKGIPLLEDLEWTKVINRSLHDIHTRGIATTEITVLDISNNTLPYNIYYDKMLRANNFDADSKTEFTSNINDIIVAYGGQLEFTIKAYDVFDNLKNTVTYVTDSPINKKIINTTIDIEDVFNTLFIRKTSEDNMISGINLNAGTKYANMEFILAIDTDDNNVTKDTKIYRMYINEHGMVTKVSDNNYDDIIRIGSNYVLYDDIKLEDISTKQNIIMWIRPRNTNNDVFYEWYNGSEINNTFLRIEKEIVRANPKALGIIRANAISNITDVIDYVNDEYIEVSFVHNINKSKKDEFTIKIDLVDEDDKLIGSVEKSVRDWDNEYCGYRFETVTYPKSVNKFKAKLYVTKINDNTFDSPNKYREADVIVYRTSQPWFDNKGLDKLSITTLDIRLSDGTSYPIDTKFWVKIESDDEGTIFEYNGTVTISDILNGYHRIYISKKPQGVVTLSVIAKEIGKYQSLIYRTYAEFVIDVFKYGDIIYDENKEMGVFRYKDNIPIGNDVVNYIKNYIRNNEPGRNIVKVFIKIDDRPAEERPIDRLYTTRLSGKARIIIELEKLPPNTFKYINVLFNGNKVGHILLDGNKVSHNTWNDWYNDYKWIYDLSIMDNGFDIQVINPDNNSLENTIRVNNINDIYNKEFNINKIKNLIIDRVMPRKAFKNIKLDINDKNLADFDVQIKRGPDYVDGYYIYKRPNNRENTKYDYDVFIEKVHNIISIKKPSLYKISAIKCEDIDIWSEDVSVNKPLYDNTKDKWIAGYYDDKILTVVIEPTTRIEFNAKFEFSYDPSINYNKNIIIKKNPGDKISGLEIDELFKSFIDDYCNSSGTSSRITSNLYKMYEANIYCNNVSIDNDYIKDCIINRMSGKTVVDVYNEVWTSKPVINGFTINDSLYNIRVVLNERDIYSNESSLRNHTLVNVRVRNATINKTGGFFKDISKVYVFKNDRLVDIGDDNYNEVFIFIPNGGNLYDIIDISKANPAATFNTKSYNITWNNIKRAHTVAKWDNELYKRPIEYVNKKCKVLDIEYRDVSRDPVIKCITFSRDYGGRIKMFTNGTSIPTSEPVVIHPMQILDDSKTYRDKIADIIMNTPELMKALVGNIEVLRDGNIKYLTKDNIWQIIEYPMMIPKFINMNINLTFDSNYNDLGSGDFIPGRSFTDSEMLNKINQMRVKIHDSLLSMPNNLINPENSFLLTEEIIRYNPIQLNISSLTAVDETNAKASLVLFGDNNGTDLDITNINYITVADYVVAYNIVYQTHIQTNHLFKYPVDDIVDRSYRSKFIYRNNSGEAKDIKYGMGTTATFYAILEEAMNNRRNIHKITPINPALYYSKPSSDQFMSHILSERFNIKEGYITINGVKVALEMDDNEGGDIKDLNSVLEYQNNTKVYGNKFIENMYVARSKFVNNFTTNRALNKRVLSDSYVSTIISEPYVFSEDTIDDNYRIIYSNNQIEYTKNNTPSSNESLQYNNIMDLPKAYKIDPFGIFISDPITASKMNDICSKDKHTLNLFNMTNGIFFRLPNITDIKADIPIDSNNTDNTDLEMIVRVEDFYTEKESINMYDKLTVKWASNFKLPNILYDNNEIKNIIGFDVVKSVNETLLLAISNRMGFRGLSRITLKPRKISDIDIDHLAFTNFSNSNEISKVINDRIEKYVDTDPEYKYEQYVGLNAMLIDSPSGGQTLRMTNYEEEWRDIENGFIPYFPVRGMMQCILNNSIPSKYRLNGIMVLEVTIDMICSIGETTGNVKYFILLNTNNVQPNLNQFNNSEGSWSNSLVFKVVPKEDNPFEYDFRLGPVFTSGGVNRNFTYKTNSNTFKIKFKKSLFSSKYGNTYRYVPIGIDGHPVDIYNNMIPKLCEYKDQEIIRHLKILPDDFINSNGIDTDLYADRVFYNNMTFYGVPIFFPMNDVNKCLWSKNWFRRISYVIQTTDNSNTYIFDSSFAIARIERYNGSQGYSSIIHEINKNDIRVMFFAYRYAINNYYFGNLSISNTQDINININDIQNDKSILPFDIYRMINLTRNTGISYDAWKAYLSQIVYVFTGFYNKYYDLQKVRYMIANALNDLRNSTTINYKSMKILGLGLNKLSYSEHDIFTAAKYNEFWNKYAHLFTNVYDNNNERGKTFNYRADMPNIDKPSTGNIFMRSRRLNTMNISNNNVDIIDDVMDGLGEIHHGNINSNTINKIVLSADLDSPINPTLSKPNILAKTKVGNTIRLLVECNAFNYIYKVVDYVSPSMITIVQPSNGFISKYNTIIDIELQNINSVIAIGNWLDGFDLSTPTYIRWNDSGYVSNEEFDNMCRSYSVVNNVVTGWYKPGIDREFKVYSRKPKKSGLYLKTHTMLTKQNDTENINRSEEYYYPLYRTITEHVNRKLDLIYGNEVLHARTSDSAEVVLPNGATFVFNPLLDYLLSVLDNTSESKLHRLY